MDILSGVTAPGPATITLPTVSGRYEDLPFSIQAGDTLTIDVGSNQEQIVVTGVNAAANSITANFTKTHQSVGVPITNVGGKTMLGNPGPQPGFNFKDLRYTPVLPFVKQLN